MGGSEITDGELEREIRKICGEADLDTITKKGVRKQLGEIFGMGEWKEFIFRVVGVRSRD